MPQAIVTIPPLRRQPTLREPAGWGKYGFDLGLILLFSPAIVGLLIAVALLVSLQGGRIFFCQERVGRNGKTFRMWKFRTMVPEAERRLSDYLDQTPAARRQWERDRKLHHDPRVTPIGRVLRRSSMDELPQLWNVLKGEMSLVGPRPVPRSELLAKYHTHAAPYLACKPGLTGLWQISGRNRLSYRERIAKDAQYHRQKSLWLDLRILLRTIAVILRRDGW